ncbi:MAG: prolyl oligopeptidase family serine peptidase, partial [Candidatus Latescibacteria bacterium]|nr:prolyl oligopeptidase family serine peptidase [Candidatus Latescibacterota bacterium]
MTMVASYGSWKSPISAEMLTEKTIGLGGVQVDESGLYWVESRPEEAGRSVIVHRDLEGNVVDLLPVPLNVRSRVHEYGEGAYTIAGGMAYFTNFEDQQIYSVSVEEPPKRITDATDQRFADYVYDEKHQRLIGIREDHSGQVQEPMNEIVGISLAGEIEVLVSGSDFYSSPCLSPDGLQLAWISWEHPNMPWDETALWVANVNGDGSLGERVCIVDGESVCQPKWSPEGTLYFVSDRSEWWNIYRFVDGQVESVYATDAEFAGPQWVFGNSDYVFSKEDHIVCTYTRGGRWYLAHLYPDGQVLKDIDLPYEGFGGLQVYEGRCYFTAGTSSDYGQLVGFDVETEQVEIIRQSGELSLDESWISIPEAVAFPTEADMTAHAFYYAPKNPDFDAPEGECPPVIVMVHGGPTGSTSAMFALAKQYWTSRGFAILDVNYRGSTGYGRPYRDALKGQWGVADV